MVLHAYHGHHSWDYPLWKRITEVVTIRAFFRGFKKGTTNFGNYIATLVNTILLFFVYILGVGASSIMAKVTGKELLVMKTGKETYWGDLNIKTRSKQSHYRQF